MKKDGLHYSIQNINIKGALGKPYRKMTASWLEDNFDSLQKAVNGSHEEQKSLARKAKMELNYSPNMNTTDIWGILENQYISYNKYKEKDLV